MNTQEFIDKVEELHVQFQNTLDSLSKSIPDWREQSPSMLYLHLVGAVEEAREWMARYPSKALRDEWSEASERRYKLMQLASFKEQVESPPTSPEAAMGSTYGIVALSLGLLGVIVNTDRMDVILRAGIDESLQRPQDDHLMSLAQKGIARKYLEVRRMMPTVEDIVVKAEAGEEVKPEDIVTIYWMAALSFSIATTILVVSGGLTEEELGAVDMESIVL